MIFILFLAAAWVAFAFAVCVGDFFERELTSIRPANWYDEKPETPKVMKAAA